LVSGEPGSEASRRLSRPPIAEEVIHLRVRAPDERAIERVAGFCDLLSERFPARTPMHADPGGAGRAPSVSADPAAGPLDGFALERPDGLDAVHARTSGLSLCRLRDYPGFGPLRDQARALFDLYREAVGPVEVTRVALRTINRIDLPAPIDDLLAWVRTVPDLPPGFPRQLSELFQRMTVHDAATGATAIVMQALDGSDPGAPRFYLDVDAFLDRPMAPASEDPWVALDALRTLRNEIFFASLTERTLALYR
jgi:uncharacterized protein (TIGR04255 family)